MKMRSVFYRGGGELGREWYLDGKLQNKHKGFEVYTCHWIIGVIYSSKILLLSEYFIGK